MKFRKLVLSVSILFSLSILPANLNDSRTEPDLRAVLCAKAEFDFVKSERDRIKAASHTFLLDRDNLNVINQVGIARHQLSGTHTPKGKLSGDK